jgi:hypothetical protein
MADYRTFYIVSQNDTRYKPNEIIVQDKLRVIVNKMEILLFTNKGDVMADLDMGCDLDYYVWQTNVSGDYVKANIVAQFNNYIPELNTVNWDINVSLLEGTLQDILVIDIFVDEYSIKAIFR